MRKTFVSVVLAGLLILQSIAGQQPGVPTSIKQRIAALPPNTHVELRLQDGSRVDGQILSRGDTDFAFTNDKGGGTQSIAYDQVRSVSRTSTGRSKAKWIIIGAVAGAAVVVAIVGILVARLKIGY